MYLLYVDESGDPANANEEYYVLGGVCMFERQAYWLGREFEDLQKRHFPEATDPIEFHIREIVGGKKPPWSTMSQAQRLEVMGHITDIIRRLHNDTRLFGVAIHKASFPNRNLIEFAFEQMCMRFDTFLGRGRSEGVEDLGLMVFDESRHETRFQQILRE